MSQTSYVRLVPANEMVTGTTAGEVFCLADVGREYVVYLTNAQKIRINLTHCRRPLRGRWFNPRSGEYFDELAVRVPQTREELLQHGSGDPGTMEVDRLHNLGFEPPEDSGDWVLHLVAEQ